MKGKHFTCSVVLHNGKQTSNQINNKHSNKEHQ